MSFENVLKKIISSTNKSREDVEKRVLEKQQELSGLVSLEGAAYIVAKEMGLDLVERRKKEFKIKNIVPGIRLLDVKGRIVRVFEAKEYEKNGNKFKVGNVILGDDTGTIRMSLWDQQTEVLDKLTQGMAIEVFGGYSRDNGRGEVELRIGRKGGIRQIDGKNIPEVVELEKTGPKPGVISDFVVGGSYKVRVMMAQLFEVEQFFEICPSCGSRTKPNEGKYNCKEHGEIEPDYSIVVSGVVDDGTSNIRAVFFGETAAKLLGMDMKGVLNKKGKLFETVDITGKDFIFVGRVRRNQMFNRLEFIVSDLEEMDEKKEAESLIKVLAPDN